jgi:kelch-like protein 10
MNVVIGNLLILMFNSFICRADKWCKSTDADLPVLVYHGMCAMDNLIYIVGGYNGRDIVNSLRCYNPVTQEWMDRACLHRARCFVSVCCEGQ